MSAFCMVSYSLLCSDRTGCRHACRPITKGSPVNPDQILPRGWQLFLNSIGLAGLLAAYASLFFRRPDAPMIGSTEPGDRVRWWKTKDRYRGPGFWLLVLGWGAVTVTMLINTAAWIYWMIQGT